MPIERAVGLGVAALTLGYWVGAAAIAAAGAASVMGSAGARRIGGITGDVLGAAEQTAEIAVFLLGTLVVVQNWAGLPWFA